MSLQAFKRFFAAAAAATLLFNALPASAEYVTGLDPYGDNFLSLRTGPGSQYAEIERMGQNTYLRVVGRVAPWFKVQLTSGLVGWASSRYIAPGSPR